MRHQPSTHQTPSPPLYTTTPAPQSISLTTPPKGRFYFAFGSNLSTTQMLQRCPSSAQPLAVARLNSYSWFICERGYANVIAVPPWEPSLDTDGSVVYGLIYWLTTTDEETLDGFEGFHLSKCGGRNPVEKERRWKPYLQGNCDYNKFYLRVRVEEWIVPAPGSVSGVVGGGIDSSKLFDISSPDIEFGGKVITTLVYVDEIRTTPGRIKEEYVARLSRAALESIPYGMPEKWFDANMKRHGVEWWKAGGVKHDRDYSKLFIVAPPKGEWEDLRARLLVEDIQKRDEEKEKLN